MPTAATAVAPVLLAQLLAPSPQPGPVRLPALSPPPRQELPPLRSPLRAPDAPQAPGMPPVAPGGLAPEPATPVAPVVPDALMPRVEGLERYPPPVLQQILAPCLAPQLDSAASARRRELGEPGGPSRDSGAQGPTGVKIGRAHV